MGKSYWGNDAVYAFNADKSVLNVITETGMILVYKRATTPNGVYTCSLIRKTETLNDQNNPTNVYNPVYPMPYHQNPLPIQESSTMQSTSEAHLTEAQYLHNYQGFEDIVKGIFETFRIAPDMHYGPRVQNMQTLHDCQKSMREIRQEAAKYGINIPQSSYETATPN